MSHMHERVIASDNVGDNDKGRVGKWRLNRVDVGRSPGKTTKNSSNFA